NFQTPNPEINFDNSPFYVNTKLTEWKSNENPLRAGVSSFGMGGTNVHVVLEEASEKADAVVTNGICPSDNMRPNLLVVSAKTETALETATVNLVNYLKENPDLDLAEVAYTLQVGRKAFDYRRMVVAETIDEAIEKLTASSIKQHQIGIDRPITFMFSGQGSQYVGMAQGLYQTEPVFKENCDRCFQILEQYLDKPLQNTIFSSPSSPLQETQYAQPAIFTIEYALAQLWMSWGIEPTNAIGHSIGEYVAATLAGVFSLEDALRVVARRGQLMQQCPTGAMLSVAVSAERAISIISDSTDLSLAVINAPELCVISGTENAIALLEAKLPQQGIACRRLHTSHAFHSAMMDGILAEFTTVLAETPLYTPQLPFISNVTGTWITDAEATDPQYWAKHLRQTVNFSSGIKEILQTSNSILLEIGGGRTLATLAKQVGDTSATVLTSLPHPKEKPPFDKGGWGDRSFILNTLGNLWLAGADIDWDSYYPDSHPYRIPLPTYPFERQRYWIDRLTDSSSKTTVIPEAKVTQPSKKPDIKDWFYIPSWQRCQTLVDREVDLIEKHNCLVFTRYDLFSQELKV
ncbi:MAG: type I polyketide synthase, partial [Cyanobacteria bacterium J06631_2]